MRIMKQTLGNSIVHLLMNMQKNMDGKMVIMFLRDGIRRSNMVVTYVTSTNKEKIVGMEIGEIGMDITKRKKTTCHGLRTLDIIMVMSISDEARKKKSGRRWWLWKDKEFCLCGKGTYS
jgi:hypothetical protein